MTPKSQKNKEYLERLKAHGQKMGYFKLDDQSEAEELDERGNPEIGGHIEDPYRKLSEEERKEREKTLSKIPF